MSEVVLPKLGHLIGGQIVDVADTTVTIPVTNPANQQLLAKMPIASDDEIEQAITCAERAQISWRRVPVSERARLMMRFAALLKQEHDNLAKILCLESGKTFADAKGDVWRGIEVVEQAANVPSLMMGETLADVASGIDCHSYVEPIGICLGITPFNFPAMIPLWMYPIAIACGNAFILKPSEQDPLTPMAIAELFKQAGAPDGLLTVLHGQKALVESLVSHPKLKTVSFVGSVAVGQAVYRAATHSLKRAQVFGGAKNHMVILPDANKAQVINQLIGASVGAAGQRCMAISVAVFVGEANQWLPELTAAMKQMTPGKWDDDNAAYGPLISKAAKHNVETLIESGIEQGATCLLDGRSYKIKDESLQDGNWLGPSVFSNVSTTMDIYQKEIFGPVLICMHVDTLQAAIELINQSHVANGTSLFTASGASARQFQNNIEVGQVGINVPIPVPLPFFSFTGWKNSFYGDLHAYGKQAIRFYTETKTVTTRWFEQDSELAKPNTSIQLK